MRKQEPTNPDNWLYRDFIEDGRVFSKVVYLGVNDTEWDECTNAEKEQCEEEHQPKPNPEEESEVNNG